MDKGPTVIAKSIGAKEYFFVVRTHNGKEEYLSIGMNHNPKWVANFNFASTYPDADSAQKAYDLLMRDYKESKTVEVNKDVRVPGTDIILEKGDRVSYQESVSLSQLNKLATGLDKYLTLNKEYYDVYTDRNQDAVCIDITWGDWKHDHLRADLLAGRYFDSVGVEYMKSEKVTDEDGSDCYSAIHYYHIL